MNTVRERTSIMMTMSPNLRVRNRFDFLTSFQLCRYQKW